MVTLRPREKPKSLGLNATENMQEEVDQGDGLPEPKFDDDSQAEGDIDVDASPSKKRRGERETKKSKASQTEEVKNLGKEVGLVERLQRFPAAVDIIAEQWLKRITTDGPGGVARVLELVIESSRVENVVSNKTLVVAGDVLRDKKNVVGESVVKAVRNDGPGAPRIMNRKFRRVFSSFWCKCTEIAPESLLYDVDAFETIIAWLAEFAGSSARGLRMASSVAAYSLVDGLIKVRLALIDTITGLERQAKNVAARTGGRKRKGKASPQAKQVKNKIEALHANGRDLDSLMTNVFDSIFVSRYRDTCPQIRCSAIEALGSWILAYPARFLDDMHSKYVGWLLYDKIPVVRGAALSSLIYLFAEEEYAAALELFLQRFLPRVLEMTRDVDNSVARRAIDLCTTLVKYDVLDESECESVYDLCPNASSFDGIRKASGLFIAELFRARRIEEGGSPRPKEELRELVFTVLRKGGEAEVALAVNAMWDALPSLRSWESYAMLLSESCETGQSKAKQSKGNGNDTRGMKTGKGSFQNKENCENYAQPQLTAEQTGDDDALTSREKVILAQLLVAAAREQAKRMNSSNKKSSQDEKLKVSFTLALAPRLNSLLTHYQSEAEVLASLAQLPQYFHLPSFKYHHHEAHFEILLERMGDILLRHTSNYLALSSAAHTMKHLSKTAHPLQPSASVALSKEASRAMEALDSFALLGLPNVRDSVALGSALSRALSLASVTQASNRTRKNVLSLLQARVDGISCVSGRTIALQCVGLAVTLIMWFIPEVRPILLGEKGSGAHSPELESFLQYREEILRVLAHIAKDDHDAIIKTKAAIAICTLLTICASLSSSLSGAKSKEGDRLPGNNGVGDESLFGNVQVDVCDFDIGKTLSIHLLQVVLDRSIQRALKENEAKNDGVGCGSLLAAVSQAIFCGALPARFSYLPILGLCLGDMSQSKDLSTAYDLAKLFHLRMCGTAEELQAIKVVGLNDDSTTCDAVRNLVSSIGSKYAFGRHEHIQQLIERVLSWIRKEESSRQDAVAASRKGWAVLGVVCELLAQRLPAVKSGSVLKVLHSIDIGAARVGSGDGNSEKDLDFRRSKKAELIELFEKHQRGESRAVRKRRKKLPKAVGQRTKSKRRPRSYNSSNSVTVSPVRRSTRKRRQVSYTEEGEDVSSMSMGAVNGSRTDSEKGTGEDEVATKNSSGGETCTEILATEKEGEPGTDSSGSYSSKRNRDGTPKTEGAEDFEPEGDADFFGDRARVDYSPCQSSQKRQKMSDRDIDEGQEGRVTAGAQGRKGNEVTGGLDSKIEIGGICDKEERLKRAAREAGKVQNRKSPARAEKKSRSDIATRALSRRGSAAVKPVIKRKRRRW